MVVVNMDINPFHIQAPGKFTYSPRLSCVNNNEPLDLIECNVLEPFEGINIAKLFGKVLADFFSWEPAKISSALG